MREFFSLEGSFNKYAGFVADTLILSLLWVFFSVIGLGLTVGASTSALFYVSTRRIANREGYITSDFWMAFKANLKPATMFWLLILFFILLIITNIIIVINDPEAMGSLSGIMLPAQIVILLEILFIASFVFPITARFDMGFKETLKSSFFMANRHMLTSVICVATPVLLFIMAVSSVVLLPLIFVIPGISAMVSSYFIMRVFKRYRPEMDKDPILELQEIEQKRAEEKRLAELGKSIIMNKELAEGETRSEAEEA